FQSPPPTQIYPLSLHDALPISAAGMNATEKLALRELLVRIKQDGKTILLIEHDVKLVMGLCDRITVLDYGKPIAEGVPSEVQSKDRKSTRLNSCHVKISYAVFC